MQFRSKETVEAIQWTGDNRAEVLAFVRRLHTKATAPYSGSSCLKITFDRTAVGVVGACVLDPKDWAVVHNGQVYAMSSTNFAKCWGPVEETIEVPDRGADEKLDLDDNYFVHKDTKRALELSEAGERIRHRLIYRTETGSEPTHRAVLRAIANEMADQWAAIEELRRTR